MSFSTDHYGNFKQSKMFLYNPQKNPIGTIVGTENVRLTKNFNNLFELNFTIYKNVNNEETEFYNQIIKDKLIEVQYINWFQILSAVEKYDERAKDTYKEVKCCPLENALIYRKIYDITGVFSLYDISSPDKGLLNIINKECGWTISHVSNELLSKYRNFDIDSMQIYNLLTTKISDSFGCVVKFNSYDKSIGCYTLDELGDLTDIVISKKNILKEYVIDDSDSAIITKMRISGGSDNLGGTVDVRQVNFGRNYIINLDYFMNDSWIKSTTVSAWNSYKTKYNNAVTSYTSVLSTLKTQQAELLVLQTALTDIESNKSAQDNVMGASITLHGGAPISTDSDYTNYQNAVTLVSTYITQIVNKKSEITSKKAQIEITKLSLNDISAELDMEYNFTADQIKEINNFITEDQDYTDETFIITDTMSETEIIDMKLELLQNATAELARISQPQYTISIKASNIFSIQDDKNELISYKEWIENNKFEIGNLITIKLSDSQWMTVRLISMSVDFDNPEDIELVFSNRNRLDDSLVQLAEVIADAGRTTNSYNAYSFGYKKASEQTNAVREFMNSTIDASLNAMKSNDNQELLIDKFGLHMRKWLSDQNKYDDHQSWWNNNTLLFTDDNWRTSKGGVGIFTDSGGNKIMSVFADVIAGQLIMGEKLTISNSSGNYTINNSGFNASATLSGTTYSVGINPSTPTDLINVKVNGTRVFYIDTVSQSLAFTGKIIASSFIGGSISSSNYSSGVSGMYIDLTSGNLYSKNFSVVSGNATLTNGSISITNGVNTININPSSGIEMLRYSTKQLYFDGSGNLTMSGNLSVTNGTNTVNINATNGIELLKGTTKQFYFEASTGNATFKGDITGATITGSTFNRTNSSSGLVYTTIDDSGFFQNNSGSLRFQVGYSSQNGYILSDYSGITIGSTNNYYMQINSYGIFANSMNITTINGGTPITTSNRDTIYTLYSSTTGTAVATAYSNEFRPHSAYGDNSVKCGSPSYRWSVVYAGTATINTSDANEKTIIGNISESEKRVALKIKNSFKTFRFNDAISKKGNNARIHVGAIAQEVKQYFEEENLDVTKYAMFCSDTWYEKNGCAVDENEKEYSYEDEGVIEKTRLGLRYEELLCFVISCI